MADKKDFHTGEEGEEGASSRIDEFDSPGSPGAGTAEAMDASSPGPQKPLPQSLLLLLCLLLLCLAGSYYFLDYSAAAAKKQTAVLPVLPGRGARKPTPPPSLESAPAEQPLEKGIRGKSGVGLPAAAEAADTASPPGPAEKPAPESSPPGSRADMYVLQTGAFLAQENLDRAKDIVRSLGFEPRLSPGRKTVNMTRLRVGRYPLKQARAKVRELKALALDVFLMPEGGQARVYTGSFSDPDKARSYAARLDRQGVQVEEEPVGIVLPTTILTFGDYVDMPAARQAAEQARAKGLDVLIVSPSLLVPESNG